MAADRETYRGDLSGVPEDLHGPPLSSLDFHEIETTGVGNKMDALLSYIDAFFFKSCSLKVKIISTCGRACRQTRDIG